MTKDSSNGVLFAISDLILPLFPCNRAFVRGKNVFENTQNF